MGFSLASFVDAWFRRSFAAAGLRSHTVEIDADTTIHCWIPNSLPRGHRNSINSDSDSNPKPKPVLLLIHGFGPSATWQWRHQVGPLSRHFDVVVPDLVFFGRSSTRSRSRSEAFQAAALAALLRSLGLLPPSKPISVVGTSYGGFVAYHLARTLGAGAVGKVVIASSNVLKAEGDDAALAERAGVKSVADLMLPQTAAGLRLLIDFAVHRPPRILPEFILRDAIQNLYSNREEKLELMKGITLGNKDLFQFTPLPQEVMIIWGEHDRIFPLEKAFELKSRLGDNARLEILKNTSHVPQSEDPEKFNEVLLNFFFNASRSLM